MASAPPTPAAAEFDLPRTALAPGTTLIEASAGTGKTFTLAGLYLRLLLEHRLKVEQLLVVTYTKAATGELRDRIRRILEQAHRAFEQAAAGEAVSAELPDYLKHLVSVHAARAPALARELDSALSGFDQAAIYTIHGFCQRALRDRAFETASLFDLELLPDQADLQARAAEDFWRREILTAGSVPLALAIAGLQTPADLLKCVRDLLQHPRLTTLPEPARAPSAAAAAVLAAHACLRAEWLAQSSAIRAAFGSQINWGNNPYKDDDKVQALFTAVEAALTHDSPAPEAFAALADFTTSAIQTGRKKNAKELPPDFAFFTLCDAFLQAREDWLIALRQAALRTLREEVPVLKARLKVQSYDDLLHRLDAALRGPAGPALASALRAQFHAALIDEFQDTDPLQFDIFQRVFQAPAADGRLPFLFLIGDPKQAIYRFRGADLHTYLLAKRTAHCRYTLRQNFRSETPLVAGVNAVFARNPRAFLADDIPFEAAHAAGQADQQPFNFAGKRPPALQIWLHPPGARPQGFPAGQAERTLPPILASEIVRLLNSGARLGDRPLAPRDLAVLIPVNHQAHRLQQALAARGVPAVLQTTASLFDADEVGEMRRLLAALANPGDEGLLKSALATTALGLDAAQLQAAAQDDAVWQDRCESFAELSRLWARAGFLPMFRALLQRERVRARLLALPDGERRLTNLLHLAEVLHDAARERQLSRAGLLAWLDEQAAAGTKSDAFQLRLEQDEQAVRIATIHRSKGLQYGIVFCPYSWKGVRRSRRETSPLFHRQDTHGRPELVFDFGSSGFDQHVACAEEEELAEQVRQYYVALTRAAHRCVFVWGRFNEAGTSAAAWLLHPPGPDQPPLDSVGTGSTPSPIKPLPPDTGKPPLDALAEAWKTLTPERLEAGLHELAVTALPGSLEVVPLPQRTNDRYVRPVTVESAASARRFTGHIQRDWRLSSFSSLAAAHPSELPDHDAHPAPPPADTPASGIFAFPRGARTGNCLHQLFEHLDFTRATAPAARELILRTLREHGIATHWADDLGRMIGEVLHAPLDFPATPALARAKPSPRPPLMLAGIPPANRLNELEFCFPVGRLDPRTLHACFTRHAAPGEEPARFAFDPVTGLIKGFVDLIFAAHDRFYLVDWKSNWLGNHPTDYAPDRLAEEIRRRRYDLQYHLYTVALDKYLRARLPGYDYDRHFGGVAYVFLRGVDAAHPGCGLYLDRPSARLVQDLSDLLAPAA
jgi:exodeoxyribonuclease V beta subunit